MGEGYPSSSHISPTNNLNILGLCLKSLLPAPDPVFVIFISGRPPNPDESPFNIAAPVGVVNSNGIFVEYTGTPLKISAVAGAGTGKIPCPVLTEPPPRFTGEK